MTTSVNHHLNGAQRVYSFDLDIPGDVVVGTCAAWVHMPALSPVVTAIVKLKSPHEEGLHATTGS